MMTQPNRLKTGGEVDRSRSINFTFDGNDYLGYVGDTLASALLANGVHLVGRSFKYHRPRGIMAAGVEEPNALVQIGEGASAEPNIQATTVALYDGLVAKSQNRWPSLSFDIGALNDRLSRFFPTGFYYKTFMWPAGAWRFYEYFVRKAAGLGMCPDQPDPDSYDERFAHFDVLVVGAGAAGLEAAVHAGRHGARVCLIEQSDVLGGMLRHHPECAIDGLLPRDWIARARNELAALNNVTILNNTTATGNYGHNFLVAVQCLDGAAQPEPAPPLPRQRLWKIRSKQVILAAGAHERPLVFANNDRPGVMLSDALAAYIHRHGVLPGRRIIVFTNNDSAYRPALYAARAGATVRIIDVRESSDGYWPKTACTHGIRIDYGKAVVHVDGKSKVKSATIMQLSPDGSSVSGPVETDLCDLIAVSGGWSSVIHLHAQARGSLRYDVDACTFVASKAAPGSNTRCVGAADGCFDLKTALERAAAVGADAAMKAGFGDGSARQTSEAEPVEVGPAIPLWLVPKMRSGHDGYRKHFHEFQNDSTVADIELAIREGFEAVEHLKRYTTTGMATDQGKMSNINVLGIIAMLKGQKMEDMAPTTYRPPFTPVTLGALAGRQHQELFSPERKSPIHTWHQLRNVPMERVGDWLRPGWFPKDGEDKISAIHRECIAVRTDVGMMDASTLGKIDVRGPDAAEFLNRIYTNAWSKLGIGKCRYGLMLNEQGYVFDDGVTTRLGDDHFHMTTTTGGAARVMTWLEDWLQTEWQDLEVYLTSVSDQWAVITLSGPKARDLLSELTDIDLKAEALPFMSMLSGPVAGVPARIFRISFSGELSFEINVAARHGLSVWKALWSTGRKYGLTPYGTETSHVLRAEKGFIVVGQDTDGTVTPMDLGMDWIVSKKKGDFLGRRSFELPVIAEHPRKQLVGLLATDSNALAPEGAHITGSGSDPFPCSSIGHITSSYFSPCLDRTIAMALVENGRDLHGQKVFARNLDASAIEMKVCQPVFFDKSGERTHG